MPTSVRITDVTRLCGRAPFGVYVLDRDLRCVWVNEHVARMDALPAADHEGRPFHEVAPGPASVLLPVLEDALLRDAPVLDVTVDCDTPATPTARSRFRASVVPLHDDAGRPIALVLELDDLAASRQAARLRQSESTLRTVVDLLPVGVWFTDPEGTIVYGNPAGKRVWGGEALVGVEDYGEYQGWWADTGKRIAASEWALARALCGETSLNELIDIKAFDGTRKRVLNSALPLRTEDGHIHGAMVLIEDITPRYRAEQDMLSSQQRLAAVVTAAADAIITTDGSGHIESINPAAERTFGYDAGEIIGRPIEDLISNPPEEGAAVMRALTGRRKHGASFPAEVSVSPMEHLGSEIWIIRDVSERKKVEAALRKTERLAVIGNLAAGLAHDMTNLVAPIGMAVRLLGQYDLPEAGRRSLKAIGRCASSLEDLTCAVRQLVREDPAAAPQPVDLSAWWTTVHPLFEAALPPEVTLSGEFEHAGSVTVNEGQLTRALLNLVMNAGEALVEGGGSSGHITVRGAEDVHGVVIRVSDNGPGIPAHLLPYIFEPFVSASTRPQSTGLGLPMVKAFAVEAGGSVSIVSEAGQGTEVVLSLPRAAGARPPSGNNASVTSC